MSKRRATVKAPAAPVNPLVDGDVLAGTLSRAADVLKYLQTADINAAGGPSEDVIFGQSLILRAVQEAVEHVAQQLEGREVQEVANG